MHRKNLQLAARVHATMAGLVTQRRQNQALSCSTQQSRNQPSTQTWRWPIVVASMSRCSKARPSENRAASAVAGSGGGTSARKCSVVASCRYAGDARAQPSEAAGGGRRRRAAAVAAAAGWHVPTSVGSPVHSITHHGAIQHRRHAQEPPVRARRLGLGGSPPGCLDGHGL